MRRGIIQFYLTDKGFGYIRDLTTREEFFFTKKNLKTPVKDKDEVWFEIGENTQGLYAYNIKLV